MKFRPPQSAKTPKIGEFMPYNATMKPEKLMEARYSGLLFKQDFLTLGIQNQRAWKELPPKAAADFTAECAKLCALLAAAKNPNEARTRKALIDPLMDFLGWKGADLPETAIAPGDTPDALLYQDNKTAQRAGKSAKKAPALALALLEAKKWNLPLDRRDKQEGTPSSQILRYLRSAERTEIKWGVLTNGAKWRLYYRLAQSRSEHFLELDLPEILALPEAEKSHWLRVFMLVFRRESFLPQDADLRTFHEIALDEGKNWEQAITEALSRKIMEEVFPNLSRALAKNVPELQAMIKSKKGESPEAVKLLREVRDNTVILLYRLLFVLYAEDRHLLPVAHEKYKFYSLRKIRDNIGRDKDMKMSATMDKYYSDFKQLCRAVDIGDSTLALPAYNGGLFDPKQAELLQTATLLDRDFGAVVLALSLHGDERIHYHDLSVQHLGAIYEQFLEQELYITPAGDVAARLNRFSRKTGGSYYTPDDLVRLVVERTVGGLLQQRRLDFAKAQKAKLPAKKLREQDSAMRALEIKVCDPAMGSGHFLVSLVDYLADWTLAEISAAEKISGYESPLAAEISVIRKHIENEAEKGGWDIKKEQLEDRQIIRRIALKKCVYGADKNFMAVELAKLSLWLHTFTVGAPLTFLDHHLRCGDSLFGEWTISAMKKFDELDCNLEAEGYMKKAEKAAKDMAEIEELTDSDIQQARASKEKYEIMRGKAEVFNRALSLLHVLRWIDAGSNGMARAERKAKNGECKKAVFEVLMNLFNNGNGLGPAAAKLKKYADDLARREDFMHWESAFPGVWHDWKSPQKRGGGFDAIVGNPPWNKMRMEDAGWFSARLPEISRAPTKAARKKKIAALIKSKHPVAAEYQRAEKYAAAAMTVARDCGDYPVMGHGDMNLYSLFVERALTLAKPDAFIGLLMPSGIYGDKTSSEFFNNLAVSERLHSLLDFINSPQPFFPEVHRSFKFCAFIFGGAAQKFAKAECAYFLNSTENLEEKLIEFRNGDFRRVNPNTGNAPIFLNQREAQIALDIYRRLPVLHKHGIAPVWRAKYFRMYDMASDSRVFQNADDLRKAKFFHVANNCYKRGTEHYLPLYEGKMVQMFDHRAADVVVNLDNLNRPGQPKEISSEKKQNFDFFPEPRFWVSLESIAGKFSAGFGAEEKKIFDFLPKATVAYKHISAPTNERGIIAAVLPSAGIGHSMGVFAPAIPKRAKEQPIAEWLKLAKKEMKDYKEFLPFMAANLNSFVYDFLCRQKMQGQNISWYILEQLPVVPPADYQKKFGGKTAAEIIRDHVLRLTYTANDMAAFARDIGYKGKPFIWNEEERMHLRARLDALYFILYGIEYEDAKYIMDSFPITRREDKEKHGGYLTRDLILNYLNAFADGADIKSPLPRYIRRKK
ncbi:MAG: Eco57I restriction-modification methylase domain-containing protein [Gammaproteobacteria bacterium]